VNVSSGTSSPSSSWTKGCKMVVVVVSIAIKKLTETAIISRIAIYISINTQFQLARQRHLLFTVG